MVRQHDEMALGRVPRGHLAARPNGLRNPRDPVSDPDLLWF